MRDGSLRISELPPAAIACHRAQAETQELLFRAAAAPGPRCEGVQCVSLDLSRRGDSVPAQESC